jgi:kumamolisin
MSARMVFYDSVTPLPDQTGLTEHGLMVNAAPPEHRDETMTLLFSLAISQDAQAELETRVAKGEVVPLEGLQQKYTPNASDVEALVSWLKAQGFEVMQVSGDCTSVYARASVAQFEQSLGVKMVRVTKDGLTYTAAQDAPSLPLDVGKYVHAIIGLQPFRQAHKNSRRRVPRGSNRVSLARNPASTLTAASNNEASPNIENAPPYLVREVLKAYNADGLPVTGKGKTIAIRLQREDAYYYWHTTGSL